MVRLDGGRLPEPGQLVPGLPFCRAVQVGCTRVHSWTRHTDSEFPTITHRYPKLGFIAVCLRQAPINRAERHVGNLDPVCSEVHGSVALLV